MRGFGGERVIRSLLSYSRSMSARAIIATIGYKIKENTEAELYRNYTARCLRILTENTAVPAVYYSEGEQGSYLSVEFDDIINPKPQKEYVKGEIAEGIKAKLR